MTNVSTHFNKTRIAPTPSGFLHLGNLFSFIITAYLAKKFGTGVLLRIDDLDRQRVKPEYIQDIFDTLHYSEISWDEGPVDLVDFEKNYTQMNRLHLYNQALNTLKNKNMVYGCLCSRKDIATAVKAGISGCNCAARQISLDAENVTWRFITGEMPEVEFISFNYGIIKQQLPAALNNFIVKKKDGFPAYQLTSLIDDIHYDVDLVVRGNDLLPSTIAQMLLANALDLDKFQQITFLHHPLIFTESGEKLSKTAGSASIKQLRSAGTNTVDMVRFIADKLGFKRKILSGKMLAEYFLNDISGKGFSC